MAVSVKGDGHLQSGPLYLSILINFILTHGFTIYYVLYLHSRLSGRIVLINRTAVYLILSSLLFVTFLIQKVFDVFVLVEMLKALTESKAESKKCT